MKKLIPALFLLISITSFAQRNRTLSDQAEFSLVTLGPDQDEFYEAFGHSALRLVDPVLHLDLAFNYGEFSFDQPNFYLNFAKGHLNYSLGVVPYPDFRDAYIYYNRYIHEQVLDLTPEQKQKVFEFLRWNAQPANKYYLYDYFFNNCSTRIRDLFKDILKDDLQFDSSFVTTGPSIRQLTDLYLEKQPWGDLGIDIGLGSRIDKEAAPSEYMFLPEYLERSFDHAKVKLNGEMKPFVKETISVYTAVPEDDTPGWLTPWIALGFVLIVTITVTWLDYKRKKLSKGLDAALFILSGVIGIVLMLLWFATDHHACAKNLNLIWALPTNSILAFAVLKRNQPVWVKYYCRLAGALLALTLIFWMILPQQLNGFLYPFLAALLIRYGANSFLKTSGGA